jgi:hypothetical protein
MAYLRVFGVVVATAIVMVMAPPGDLGPTRDAAAACADLTPGTPGDWPGCLVVQQCGPELNGRATACIQV